MESSTAQRQTTATTIAEAFHETVRDKADRVAIKTQDGATAWTWSELRRRVDALAAGLVALGVGKGDTVALLMNNRPEFYLCDLAVMTIGGTPFSIYSTYAPEQIQFVVSDADAKVAFVEQSLLAGLIAARKDLPSLEHVIVVDGEAGDGTITLSDATARGDAAFDADAAIAGIEADDVLTLIYTSGTTGPPKGVQLCHRNLLSAVRSVEEIVQFPDPSRVVSWLPSAHIAERAAHYYLPVTYGIEVTCCDDPRQVLAVLPQVHPTWFFAVPRIWEKLKAGLETMVAGLGDEQREPTERALEAALRKVRLEQRDEEVPAELAQAVARADEQIFSKLRANLGLDQLEAVNVGAAPTPVEVLEFFHAIGIPVAELWGMSETCGAGTVNPPDRIKIGTVGPPTPGVEVTLAEDGEVLVRGDIVMLGYRNLPDKTAEAIDAEGWMHTGDIGQLDDEHYLTIVDRKKEIIINAAGKNMSPANIEATLKTASPLIGQAAVIGDAKPFNTALIVLDADFAPAWAAKNGVQGGSLEELAADERVRAAIQEGVDAANAKLARVEQIKKFTLVRGDWTPGGDELTPTMKLKRKPIAAKYAGDIEGMYAK